MFSESQIIEYCLHICSGKCNELPECPIKVAFPKESNRRRIFPQSIKMKFINDGKKGSKTHNVFEKYSNDQLLDGVIKLQKAMNFYITGK